MNVYTNVRIAGTAAGGKLICPEGPVPSNVNVSREGHGLATWR